MGFTNELSEGRRRRSKKEVMKKHKRIDLVLRFFQGSKRFFVIAIVASFATTILNSLTPQIFRFTVDSVLDGSKYGYLREHLWIMALVLMGIALLSGVAMFLSRSYAAKSGENFAKNMRDTLFMHVQKLPVKWHDKHQTGDIIQRCTSDVEVIRNFVLTQLLEAVRATFLVLVSFIMMFSMNVKLSLVVLIFVPIIIAYSTIFYRLIAKRFTLADEAEGELSTVVQENLTGVRVVRAFGREQFEMERFREKNEGFAKFWIRLGTLSGLYWGVGDLITGLQVVTVIALGVVQAVNGHISVGEFIAFASYNTSLVWPIRGLGRIFSDMSKAGVSFERVAYILGAEEETYETGKEGEVEPFDLSFSHVSFAYEDQQNVIEDISFSAPQGTVLGILGGTGSGKSTIIQLLNRLYEVEDGKGQITVGGKNIKDIPLEMLRKQVGMVLQEPFLYSRTIRENIAASSPHATLEEIRNAAKIACVDDAIMNFTDGYETIVGERGITLSGGQRQRVAIARMLLSKTPIMVFDDSLSAVDSQTDSMIRKALLESRKGTTLILISHRITTLMNADNIMVLNQGKVTEMGTHQELIRKEGAYKRIYDIQMNQDDREQMGGEAHGGI